MISKYEKIAIKKVKKVKIWNAAPEMIRLHYEIDKLLSLDCKFP